MKKSNQPSKMKLGIIAMTFTAAAVSLGCTSSPFNRNSSSGAGGEQSKGEGVGRLTGGAEARPTADPGVTPGKKPGDGGMAGNDSKGHGNTGRACRFSAWAGTLMACTPSTLG